MVVRVLRWAYSRVFKSQVPSWGLRALVIIIKSESVYRYDFSCTSDIVRDTYMHYDSTSEM